MLGKNSTVHSQSSSSCQYGSMSRCRFMRSVSLGPHFPKFVAETRGASSCHSAWIPAAPHYGLRYGCAPATGNFQRLRGRPPLVSPLKSCFHGGNTGSNPVGDAKSFQQLTVFRPPLYRHKKGTNLDFNTKVDPCRAVFTQRSCYSE